MPTKTKTKTKTKSTQTINVRPLSDRIVIQPVEAEDKTSGGIYLPDTAREKPLQGHVVSVGSGQLLDSGKRIEPTVKVGDLVMYGRYAGTEIKVDGQEYTILREGDLLGVLE